MAVASITLRDDYWETFEIQEADIEFLYNHLLEIETPLPPEDLMFGLVQDRLQREIKAIEKRRSAGGDIYLPANRYEIGQILVIPALNWQQAEVVNLRPGNNPDLKDFDVIQVKIGESELHEFAAGLDDHNLNNPPEVAEDDALLNPQAIMDEYWEELTEQLVDELITNPDFVYIAGRWFPKTLLVDVNVGHLNLAEAVLDMEGGGPLPTQVLLEQVELPMDVNLKLVEFSLDRALQEDKRFDEVGPAGKVLWFLKRLEPPEVLQAPPRLHYSPIDFERSTLTDEMLDLEKSLDDELSPLTQVENPPDEVEVRLIYPHWRSGTIPLSGRMRKLFPTAYEAPRIRISLIDGETGEVYPGWVVRSERFVYGLKEWYDLRGAMPGSMVRISLGENPGEIQISADSHRSTKEWVRTVLVGVDGGLVLAMLKQTVSTKFDDRMAIMVPDPVALDKVQAKVRKDRVPFERTVVDIFRELAKLNPQSHVHATELYAGVNLVRRCPPAPIFALLASRPWFAHLGDFYFRLTDFEG
jgi:hypothetical protein